MRQGCTCTGAFEYPAPKPARQWQRLPVVLSPGVRQNAAIYAKDGNLLRTLLADAAGVRELWWDGRDDTGRPVVPGAYEVRHVAQTCRPSTTGPG